MQTETSNENVTYKYMLSDISENVFAATSDAIEKFFIDKQIRYKKQIDNSGCTMYYQLDDELFEEDSGAYVWIDRKSAVCHVDVCLTRGLPDQYENDIYTIIARWNDGCQNGGFLYQKREKAIYYKCRYPIGNGLNEEDFRAIFNEAMHVFGKMKPVVKQCNRGLFSIEQEGGESV